VTSVTHDANVPEWDKALLPFLAFVHQTGDVSPTIVLQQVQRPLVQADD
jgi:hypothetical protein